MTFFVLSFTINLLCVVIGAAITHYSMRHCFGVMISEYKSHWDELINTFDVVVEK